MWCANRPLPRFYLYILNKGTSKMAGKNRLWQPTFTSSSSLSSESLNAFPSTSLIGRISILIMSRRRKAKLSIARTCCSNLKYAKEEIK